MHNTFMKTLSLSALAIATLVIGTSLGVAYAQPRRATTSMAPADILRVANISDAQISPNGEWVVYTVSSVARED